MVGYYGDILPKLAFFKSFVVWRDKLYFFIFFSYTLLVRALTRLTYYLRTYGPSTIKPLEWRGVVPDKKERHHIWLKKKKKKQMNLSHFGRHSENRIGDLSHPMRKSYH
jgi:hypothetical protein